MAHKVLIDYNALGWAKINAERISKDYEEILRVGTMPAPKSDSGDEVISNFCLEWNCDLITSDYTAYVHVLKIHHIVKVEIEKYSYDKEAEKHVFLIKISDQKPSDVLLN